MKILQKMKSSLLLVLLAVMVVVGEEGETKDLARCFFWKTLKMV